MKTIAALLLLCSPAFAESLRPYVYRVLSHEVIDGDTIRTELDLGFRIRVDYSARLDGIDTPELNTAAGKAVREFVRIWCARQQTLIAVSVAKDKYEGRYVAELHGDAEQLNELLLARKFAKAYDGKSKRPKWTAQELERVEREAKAISPRPAAASRANTPQASPIISASFYEIGD